MERGSIISSSDTPASPLSARTGNTGNNSNTGSPQLVRLSGRPPSLSDSDKEDSSPPQSTPNSSPQSQQPQGPSLKYRGDTESEGESEDEQEYSGQFVFAKNVTRPEDILTGPPLSNKQQSDYLKLIEEATGTECARKPKSNIINVVGPTQEAVDDALARFKQLQTLYKRRNKKAATIPCIHPNPKESRSFSLYFAPLDRYRYKHTVFVPPEIPRPLFTILPVYKDPHTGQPMKPTDLIDKPPSGAPPTRTQPPVNYGPPPSMQQPYRAAPPATLQPATSPQDSMPAATWGNRTVTQTRQTVITPEAEHWKSGQQIKPVQPASSSSSPADDFPSLPTKPAKKPTVQSPGKGIQRRVIRISNQKAGPADTPPPSIFELCRDYNLHNAQTALAEGLEHVRGHRGDIRLGVKLGKVLWGNLTPAVQSKMWPFQDIKDLAMKENKVVPIFNNITTRSPDVMDAIFKTFPENYNKTACYEIHAMARNQPSLDYQPIIMTVNPGAVGLQKVILRQDRVTEIDWVSLDRKFDFQMYLNAEVLGRTDVKPYSTFLKKLSININTCQMTYENVPNFIKVTDVFYKETTKHRLHFPFVVEISSIERLPLVPQPSMGFGVEKILADTGKGDTWFDCEVFYTSHNEFFKRNLDLSVGKLATWGLTDILGKDGRQVLEDYIRCMILITENLQMVLSSE
ncbi:hypothetical protein BC941DRAFT_344089 [Chlamydoabsidia padenii]|nr:hypothetical protein BC941DRAFT_344089 [Chlamydoabsidia padenii]